MPPSSRSTAPRAFSRPPSSPIFVWLALLLVSGPGLAQPPTQPPADEELPGEVSAIIEAGARSRIRLAFPAAERPPGASPEARAAIEELESTLRADLEASGVFDVQGPEVLRVLTLSGDRDRDFDQYASLNNEVVMLNEVHLQGDRIRLEGRVYDLKSRRLIVGKAYTGGYDLVRRIAHTFNDELVLYFSGVPGIARTQIVFTSDRDGDGTKELYLMDYDGANQRRISGHRSISLAPAWSPRLDGMAYISYYEGPPSLYWVDLQSGQKSPLLVDDAHTMSPSFSPDGSRMALSRSEPNWEIFTLARSGGRDTLRRLTNSNALDTNPAWSPNGRQIAFTSDRSGRPHIYVMDAEGTNPRRVTFSGDYNDGAAWHPEGTRVAYSRRDPSGRRFDIAVADLVTGEESILTEGVPGNHEHPTFSPDGRKIVFETSRAGGRQVFAMDADGRNLRQLTFIGSNFSPSWSPNLEQ